MKTEALPDGMIRVTIPVSFTKQGGRGRLAAKEIAALTGCDSPLVLNLARGFHWQRLIDDGVYPNIKVLAEAIGIDSGVVAKAVRLTLLSPKIVHKLILGESDLTMTVLRKSFPPVWEKQEKELLK